MMMRHSNRVMNTALLLGKKGLGGEVGAASNIWVLRNKSTLALSEKDEEKKVANSSSSSHQSAVGGGENKNEKGVMSYWGIQPSKIVKEDGTEWKWNCFRVRISLFLLLYHITIVFVYEKIRNVDWFCSHGRLTKQTFPLI